MNTGSVIIARFDSMPEAHIAMGRLEAEGIVKNLRYHTD